MKKICTICNSNTVHSKTKSYCSDCRKKIQCTINCRIRDHKEATRFFFSTSKQRTEKKDYYYNIIETSLNTLNKINQEYPFIVKNTKGTLEYIQEANQNFKTIDYIIKKSGVSN